MSVLQTETWHLELKEWAKTIQFFEDEIHLFENRLEEVVNSNTKKEILAEAEHFQNLFILQKEQFDMLKHDIHEQEIQIRKNIEAQNQVNNRIIEKQNILNGNMQQVEKIFKETKQNFYRFLSKVL